MATPSAGDLRNFAIVGHASSGKTTLSEAILACAGVIGRMGNIAQGTTVSNWKRSGVVSKYLTFSTSRFFLSRRFGTGRPCFEQDFERGRISRAGLVFIARIERLGDR